MKITVAHVRQFWPAVIGIYELIVTGLLLFNIWDPGTSEQALEQVAYVMGIPAAIGGFVFPLTHSNNRVLQELES